MPFNTDGTITALTDTPFEPAIGYGIINLVLPFQPEKERLAGRYFLARCGAQSEFERAHQWGIYFRRPLFLAGCTYLPESKAVGHFVVPYQPFISTFVEEHVSKVQQQTSAPSLSALADPGYSWLATLDENQPVNLMGPFGNGFELEPESRNLLLVAQGARIGKLLPLIDVMLNRGGRVTMIVRVDSGQEQEEMQASLVSRLPIAVELRLAKGLQEWREQLMDTLIWADQICAALPEEALGTFGTYVQEKRFSIQENFSQILVDSDLVCGVGACLACVVSTANGGHTRSCVNGPVFDLTRLVR